MRRTLGSRAPQRKSPEYGWAPEPKRHSCSLIMYAGLRMLSLSTYRWWQSRSSSATRLLRHASSLRSALPTVPSHLKSPAASHAPLHDWSKSP
jgi:hypothetical protein